ncbi:MAG: long-chain-fatty-acid--CoA ligase [Halomonas sp.]|jgi:fatty-acyl-CoA synthase|uniref:fatty acyl-CoA synthetase n=1 Tax=Halomonas sp. Ps84H-12 TaxID=2954501 RepID=UPI001DA0B6D0|nr:MULTISPECIES: fatty acyl-CoA synthetase [unclassified Halomonas]MCO7243438.1 fatty acyl-CoA synthetase [Halomonas sp. Ps84H-12]NQY78341.1 long-chain-fatty-acid--CoA ligase [Halomonas sp.]|tara:strand:- start:217 stop:1764 length:1548 start_codon:yes stop_codon:yes gene_type:complete
MTLTNSIHRNTIGAALNRSARKYPQQLALRFADRSWSYQALNLAANQVANALLEAGLVPGDRLAVYGKNSDAYVIAWLAAVKAGLVHVPVNFALSSEELGYILQQSGAKGVLSDASLADKVREATQSITLTVNGTLHAVEPSTFDVLASVGSSHSRNEPDVALEGSSLAQLLYTSGTTAAPKAAMMSHQALMAEYMACMVELDIKSSEAMLAALPLYHSAQMHVFLMPALLLGAPVILLEAPMPDSCLAAIAQHQITSFFAPPTVWISLLRHPQFGQHDLSTLKKAYYGASIMPVPVLEEMQQRFTGVGLYNCYGQSEIAPLATVLRPEEHAERPASAGRPILTVETRIVDLEGNDVAPGEHGEIVHRSPQLMVGYWDKPEMTAEAFQGGWFHSGDVGYVDEAGYLYIVDRIKDVINTGGVLVASREVEEALFKHAAIAEVAVIGLPDEKWIEAITAVVVLKEGQEASEQELIHHTKSIVAPYKVPKRIVFTDALPKSTAGKILKRHLRQEFKES